VKRKLKRILIPAALSLCLISTTAMAQQKIAVVDVQGVFQSLPQAAIIQQNIATEFKDRMENIQRMEKDLQLYLEKLKRDKATMSDMEIRDLENQIVERQEEYAEKAQPLREEMQAHAAQERNRILDLIKDALDVEAALRGYTLVLNAGAVAFMEIGEVDDLSEAVLQRVSNMR